MINEYHFGSITINGKIYNEDVEVHATGKVLPWIVKERHLIDVEEIKRAVEANPEVIIIGTGESGLAKVSQKAQEFIKEKNIELIIENMPDAVETFNKIESENKKKIIGLFHLTC